jgi:hypothetical protein
MSIASRPRHIQYCQTTTSKGHQNKIHSAQIASQSIAPTSSLIALPFARFIPRGFFRSRCQACIVESEAAGIRDAAGVRNISKYRDTVAIRFRKM